jgi:hypothetical protein
MGNGSTIVDASLRPGADWSFKVNAAIAACPSTGCTVDARGFMSPQTMSQSIDLKTPGGAVILWLPTGTINRSTGAQFEMENGAQVIGMSGTYIYNGNGDSGAVFANHTRGAVISVYVRDLTMRSEGPFTVKDNSGNPHNVTYGTGTCFDLSNALSVELYHTQAICQVGLKLSDPSYDGSYYNTFIDNIFASTNPNGAAVLLGEFPNENNFYATKFIAYGSSAVFAQSNGGFVNFNGGDIEGTGAGVFIENGTNIGIHDVYFEAIGPNCSSFPYACWQANWPYVQGAVVAGSDGKSHVCVTAGTSGSSAPTWNSTYGATTTDNTAVWRTVQYGQVVWGPGAVGNSVDGALGPQYIDNYSTYYGGTSNYQLIPPNVNGNPGSVPSNFTAGSFTLGSSLGTSTAYSPLGNVYVFDAPVPNGDSATNGAAVEFTGSVQSSQGYTGHAPFRTGGLLSNGGVVGTVIAGQLNVQGLPNPGAPIVTLFGSHPGTSTVSYALTAYCGGLTANTVPGSFTQITNAPSTPGALISATINAPGSGYQAGDVVAIGNYFTGFVGITATATAYYTVATVNGSGGVLTGSVTSPGSGYLDGLTAQGVTGGHGTGLTLNLVAYDLVEIAPSTFNLTGFPGEPWSGCGFDLIKDPAGGTSTAHYLVSSRPNMGNWWISNQLLDYGEPLSAYTPPSANTTANSTFAGSLTVNGGATLGSTLNLTGTQAYITPNGSYNYFLDQTKAGGQFIWGYNTPKTSTGGFSFAIFNNSSDHGALFAVSSAGTSSGTNQVATLHNTLEDGSGNMTAAGKMTASQLCISSTCLGSLAGSQYNVMVMGASNPGWGQVNLASSAAVTGTCGVANGCLGVANPTAYNLYVGAGASAMAAVAPSSTSGVPLISQGSSANPAYGTAVVAGGGTGATTAANALINLFPAASEVGDMLYCATYSSGCTSWAKFAGNTSGTALLQETSAGAPSWITAIGSSQLPSGWNPITIANGGTNATSAAAGTVPNATSTSAASWTATPTLGVQNSTQGTLTVAGSSSSGGSVTVASTGASPTNSVLNSSSLTLGGTTAGFVDFPQGATSSSVAPCSTASSICEQAPTSVTSYLVTKPGSAATGIKLWSNSSNVVTESILSGTSNMPLIGQGASTLPIFSSIAYPTSCTSGGWLYGSSSTAFACGTYATANTLMKNGGAGAGPAASSITDNGTDVVVTEPVIGANSTVLTSNQTTTSATLASLGLSLPAVPVSTKVYGTCDLLWETSSTSDTVVLGLNQSAASTGLQLLNSQEYTTTSAVVNLLPPAAVTTAVSTAFTSSMTAPASSTPYPVHFAFSLITNSSNAVTITVYGDITSGGTLTLLIGSACGWHI